MDAGDEILASLSPPGFPEPQPASQPAWQPSYNDYNTTADWRSNWNGWQSQGHTSEFRVDTRYWNAANFDFDAKP